MTHVDEHGRPEPPIHGDELASILGFLDYQRATFEWKTRGLDVGGLNTKVAASSMTLGGMLKHLALVEEDWFSYTLLDHDRQPPWDAVDWNADPNWDWESAAKDSPDELRTQWERSVTKARAAVDEALASGGLDQSAQRKWPDGESPSLRWILLHMIEEYARHNGHADLIREAVDGETGE